MNRRERALLAGGITLAALAVVGLLYVGLAGDPAPAPEGAHEVWMNASQFRYDPPEIEVAKGTRVVIHIRSTDVAHGIAIPEFGVKKQIPANEYVTVTFVADRAGVFEYYCTVFCGTGHPQHRGKLTVV